MIIVIIILPLCLVVDIFIFKILKGGLIIMAVNVTVYDLENYPDNPKTVTLDHKVVVPIGQEGDEKWVLSFTTTAYSDNTNRTAIQDIYVQETEGGWLKSSGFVGTGGKFTINSSKDELKIKLDNSAGAAGGGGFYTITLTSGTNLTGEGIADDMETQIRALPDYAAWVSGDSAYKLAYMSCTVEYKDGRFWIISGTVSPYYTGASRSSVKVAKVGSDTCYETLGFDLAVDSQTIAGIAVKEALVTSDYTTNTSPLAIGTGTGVVAGDCLMITDGTNTDYFTAISGTETSIEVAISSKHGYTGIANSYSKDVSKVQVLREQDPENAPVSYYDTVDSISRWGLKSIIQQIDFTS